ncbi:protein disulfide-isomerase A4 isoform X1 [Octopus sinensis]|uniref:Protein disulfide-isomerase n=1 Tax=Octopus sinensis TaxID=2607531 RepID=A0A6P7SRS6_9MOLL|nr:protein disulfide-isomerase A4 isoform X1 [Octopus sinensis]
MALFSSRLNYLLLLLALISQVIDFRCYGEEADEADEATDDDNEPIEEDDVLVLNNNNFDDVIYSRDTVLVEFYAPWCGHCKRLAPAYADAAKQLKKTVPKVSLAKIDATIETELSSRFDVNGYPTLLFFKNGKSFPYEGPREADGIVTYMLERAAPSWKPPPEAVITLTDNNFTDFIEKHELSLVEFYAPWCGHCKRLAPEYEKAAQKLAVNDPPIPLAKIDATIATTSAMKYEVSGYPTLKIFRAGKQFEYKGPREDYGIVNYMISQQGGASKLQASAKELQKYMKEDDITIVGFFNSLDAPLMSSYLDAANEVRDDYKFAHVLDKDVTKSYDLVANSIVVFVPERFQTEYEPKKHVLNKDDAQRSDILSFIEKNQFPLVGHYNFNNEKKYNTKYPLCLVFYTVDWSFDYRKATQIWRKKIAKIARNYKSITFAVANEDDHSNLMKDFGFEDSGEDMNIGIMTEEKRYTMEPMDEFESSHIESFLDDFVSGNLKPHIKSQPIPKKDKGPVVTVVANNFDSVVLDKSKDVLIEFYAPWCGHCQKLEPIYKKLAKSLQKNQNLVIAKMDATANDVPSNFKTEGFPTIYFAPTNNKENPVKFTGGRELKDFVKFLEEHSTVSLNTKHIEL